jgi:hypothetical protein
MPVLLSRAVYKSPMLYQLIKQYTKKHLAEKTDLLEALYLLTQSHPKITNHYKMEVRNVYRNLIIKLRN